MGTEPHSTVKCILNYTVTEQLHFNYNKQHSLNNYVLSYSQLKVAF
jgi:hypothetical protein